MATRKGPFCWVCDETFTSFADFGVHLKSESHGAKMKAAGKAKPVAAPAPSPAPPPTKSTPSASSSPSTPRRSPTVPCKFHSQQKACSYSWHCAFLHDDQSKMRVPEPNLFAIDVECVATGNGHNDRDVCSIAVVDSKLEVKLFITVKPSKPIVSYLTPVTGFKEGDLDDGVSLEEALEKLYALLPSDSIIVGQAPQNDIKWTKMKKGVHYSSVIDIAQIFKTSNAKGQDFYYPLQRTAMVLLNPEGVAEGEVHDPRLDAKWSMQLYLRYSHDAHNLDAAKQKLANTKAEMSVAKRLNYVCDGVCMAAYHKARCICKQE